MKNLRKIGIISLTSILLLNGCSNKVEEKTAQKSKEENKLPLVENALYVPPKDPNNLQIKAFNTLSGAVNENDLFKEAKQVAVSFALDFFNLKNKKDANDVGGLSFMPTTYVAEFKDYAIANYYSNYAYIVNEYGEDELPQVKAYKVKSMEENTFTFHNYEVNGYSIQIALSYEDTELPDKKLKKQMLINVIDIQDYPFDRAKEFKLDADFTGERLNVYKVLALEDVPEKK